MSKTAPRDRAWHWVRLAESKEWIPALRDERGAAGGWCNEDTWEDFGGQVVDWIEIPAPCDCGRGSLEGSCVCDNDE